MLISLFKGLFLKVAIPIVKDEYVVIRTSNIMIAQGWECNKCKVIRPHNLNECPICK